MRIVINFSRLLVPLRLTNCEQVDRRNSRGQSRETGLEAALLMYHTTFLYLRTSSLTSSYLIYCAISAPRLGYGIIWLYPIAILLVPLLFLIYFLKLSSRKVRKTAAIKYNKKQNEQFFPILKVPYPLKN